MDFFFMAISLPESSQNDLLGRYRLARFGSKLEQGASRRGIDHWIITCSNNPCGWKGKLIPELDYLTRFNFHLGYRTMNAALGFCYSLISSRTCGNQKLVATAQKTQVPNES